MAGAEPENQKPLSADEDPCAGLPYRVLTVLGEGPRGVTFLAQERSVRAGFVALKLLPARPEAKPIVQRYVAARERLSSLRHPNISCILDVGLNDGGQVYVATQFVAGTPLPLVMSRSLESDERSALARQLCEAFHAAHSLGVFHLCLSAASVRVTRAHGEQVLKVIDFGVATLIDAAPGGAADDVAALARLLRTMKLQLPDEALGSVDEMRSALTARGRQCPPP